MLKVGSLGVRWVLMQHADPWLLTVNAKQWSQSRLTPGKLPFLENQHNIPFMRKRCRRDVLTEAEEPPPKKSAVDRQEGEHMQDVDGSSNNTGEKLNEQEQTEKQNEGQDNESGDQLVNLEEKGGKQMQPEEEQEGVEEAGQIKMVTVEEQKEKTNSRGRENSIDEGRDDEVDSPTTGQVDPNEE